MLRPTWNTSSKENVIDVDLCWTLTRPTFRIVYARTFRTQTLYEIHLDEQLRGMWRIDYLGVRISDNIQLNQEELLAMSKVEKSSDGSGAVTNNDNNNYNL